LDSKHGHELVYMLRVLPWDTLGASVGISTRTPLLFHGVSVSQ
jgi:hypothetical protein